MFSLIAGLFGGFLGDVFSLIGDAFELFSLPQMILSILLVGGFIWLAWTLYLKFGSNKAPEIAPAPEPEEKQDGGSPDVATGGTKKKKPAQKKKGRK